MRKGYDIITNENFFGVGSKTVYPPKKKMTPSLWERTGHHRNANRTQDLARMAATSTSRGMANGAAIRKASARSDSRSRSRVGGAGQQIVNSGRGPNIPSRSRPDIPSLAKPGQKLEMVEGEIRTGGF